MSKTQAYLTSMQRSGTICNIPVYEHLRTKMGILVARNEKEISDIESLNAFKKGAIKRLDTEEMPEVDKQFYENPESIKNIINQPSVAKPSIFDTFLAKKDFDGVELLPFEGKEQIKKYIRDTIAFYNQEEPKNEMEGEATMPLEIGITEIPAEIPTVLEPDKPKTSKYNLENFKEKYKNETKN